MTGRFSPPVAVKTAVALVVPIRVASVLAAPVRLGVTVQAFAPAGTRTVEVTNLPVPSTVRPGATMVRSIVAMSSA